MTKEQIKKAYKKFFYNQQQVQFYTQKGWKQKHAYAAIIDKQITRLMNSFHWISKRRAEKQKISAFLLPFQNKPAYL